MKKVRVLTARAHRLLEAVVAEMGAHERAGEECVWLVPEQFTLQAERELMDRLHLPGLFTLQVWSPSRLSEHVLAAAGADGRKPLGSAARRVAVSRAVEKCEGKLTYYQSSAFRKSFPEKACALITDMKRGGLTAAGLRAYAQTLPEGGEGEKLRDLALLYETYQQVLGDQFSDDEDQLFYVASRLGDSGLLAGQHLYVYGFDTLPEQLAGLLICAAELAESLTVALICDEASAPDGEIYQPVRQGIARFLNALRERGVEGEWVRLPRQALAHAPAIAYLDDALFAYPIPVFEKRQDNVFLFSENSPFEEAKTVARQILRLLAEGTEPERVTVLYPDANGYAFAVEAAFRDAGLPFYTDQKLPALSHGLTRYLLGCLRAAAGGYRREDVLSVLQSGYAPVSFDEGCELQNYAVSYGVNRDRWLKPFTKGSAELCERAETARKKLIEPIARMRAGLVSARTTHESLTAVFGLLSDAEAYETLKREENRLLEEGMAVRASQNSQIWKATLELLDQLYALLGGARLPLAHAAAWLESGLSTMQLSALPPASHMVQAGTLGHSLPSEMDAVFLLGLTDGLLARQTDSLLTEEERARTQAETGAFLGVTDESRAQLSKLDLKRAMTLPDRLLFLSFSKTTPDGATLHPLGLLNTMEKKLFAQPIGQSPVPKESLPLSAAQALEELSVRLRAFSDGVGSGGELPDKWRDILGALLSDQRYAQRAAMLLRAADAPRMPLPLRPESARALYGSDTLSVSRLEQYAQCPFKHFIGYGLRPQVVKEWKVEPVDTGVFYHDALSAFGKLAGCMPDYPKLDDGRVTELADEAMAPLLDTLLQGPMGDGARSRCLFDRARQTIRRAALTMTRHLRAGKFQIAGTEASFGYPGGLPPIVLALSDGREVMVRGRIDRVDRYDGAESVYLRVIDYKSSQQELDAAKTWWGLQLQLLLYLDVCVNAVEGAKPAGAFYFYVADPLVETEEDIRETVESKLRELLVLRGVTLSEVEVLHAMDEEEIPVALPRMLDKNGEIKKEAKAVDLPQMRALLAHAREVATGLAERMMDGRVEIHPARSGSNAACGYCDYRAICGFDPDSADADFADVPAMDMQQLRAQLDQIT